MSELNSINGGYKGGSPKVRSENSKKPFIDTKIKLIDTQQLVDNIILWYESGRILPEGIQSVIDQLQQLCNIERTEYSESFLSLKTKKDTLDTEIQSRKDNLSSISKTEDLADMVKTIETFFGKDKIEEIRNLLKK